MRGRLLFQKFDVVDVVASQVVLSLAYICTCLRLGERNVRICSLARKLGLLYEGLLLDWRIAWLLDRFGRLLLDRMRGVHLLLCVDELSVC